MNKLPPELVGRILELVGNWSPIWQRPRHRLPLKLTCRLFHDLITATDDVFLVVPHQAALVHLLTRVALDGEVATKLRRLCVSIPLDPRSSADENQFSATVLTGILDQCRGLTHLVLALPPTSNSLISFMGRLWDAVLNLADLRSFTYLHSSRVDMAPDVPQDVLINLVTTLPYLGQLSLEPPIDQEPGVLKDYPGRTVSPFLRDIHLYEGCQLLSIERENKGAKEDILEWLFAHASRSQSLTSKRGTGVNEAAKDLTSLPELVTEGNEVVIEPLPSWRHLHRRIWPLGYKDDDLIERWKAICTYDLDTVEIRHKHCQDQPVDGSPPPADIAGARSIVHREDQMSEELATTIATPCIAAMDEMGEAAKPPKRIVLRCQWTCDLPRVPDKLITCLAKRGIAFERRKGFDAGWVVV